MGTALGAIVGEISMNYVNLACQGGVGKSAQVFLKLGVRTASMTKDGDKTRRWSVREGSVTADNSKQHSDERY